MAKAVKSDIRQMSWCEFLWRQIFAEYYDA